MNIDWLSFWEGITPHETAITTLVDQRSYSYHEIQTKANQVANLLTTTYNLSKGERVAIVAQNCIEYIYLFGAAQKCGIVLVPLNYRLTAHELDHLIEDAKPSLLIVEEGFETETDRCPSISLDQFSIDLATMSKAFNAVPIDENEAVFILYTSGSTGFPKGVIYTHKMLFWNSVNTSVSLGVNSESIALVCMPPFHTGGWNVLLTPLLHHGGHVVISKKFDADETLLALEKYHCNQFMAVPTMLKMMHQSDQFTKVKLNTLAYIIVGGEAMPLELIEVYEERKIAIRQGFGMTEVGPNLTSLHHSQSRNKIGSIGKPNMYVNVLLLDQNDQEVNKGELGELCFAGPVVMPGYWNKPSSSNVMFDDKWFRSGDIAIQDEEGYLYIKDRIKNMFISGGENVYPAEIERFLHTHPSIDDVVIIGTPDPKWGEVGKAFIKSKEALKSEDIVSFCSGKISKYKIPKYYKFLNELPLNASGKIDRSALHKL